MWADVSVRCYFLRSVFHGGYITAVGSRHVRCRSGREVSFAFVASAFLLFISNSELSVAVIVFVTISLSPLKVQVPISEDIRHLLDKTKEVRQPIL